MHATPGFLAPAVFAALASCAPVTVILWVITALAVLCPGLILSASNSHLPQRAQDVG
jgi:amino acid transporter